MSKSYRKQSKIDSRRIGDYHTGLIYSWEGNLIYKEVINYKFQPGALTKVFLNRQKDGYKQIYESKFFQQSYSWQGCGYGLTEEEFFQSYDDEIREFIITRNLLVTYRHKRVVGQRKYNPRPKVDSVKCFWSYKPANKIKPYRIYKSCKAEKREAARGFLFKDSDKVRFDIDSFSKELGFFKDFTQEELDSEQYDIQMDMEYYYGYSNLNDFDQSIIEEINYTPLPRAKVSAKAPIWDDNYRTGLIKERRTRKFKQSIKYIDSYIS